MIRRFLPVCLFMFSGASFAQQEARIALVNGNDVCTAFDGRLQTQTESKLREKSRYRLIWCLLGLLVSFSCLGQITAICPTQVSPEMPRKARREEIEGVVRTELTISGGEVKNVEILSGPAVFHSAVIAAAKQYKCTQFVEELIVEQAFAFRFEDSNYVEPDQDRQQAKFLQEKRAQERALFVEQERQRKLAESLIKEERDHFRALLTTPLTRQQDWKEHLDSSLQTMLRSWLEPKPEGFDEVPQPVYPPAVFVKQEVWETDREFEQRVETLRAERKRAIESLEKKYLSDVEARNLHVAQYNKLVQDRRAQLPEKRRELTLAAIEILDLKVSLGDVTFDPQSGALTIGADIQGLKQTFAFLFTAQAFRRAALTSPHLLKIKPEFQVSDSGEVTLEALKVYAQGASAVGVPAVGITTPIRLASATLSEATAGSFAQQSSVTVDRNQVEQILYRDENEMLRKRLAEQRKQQEQAVATAEAKAAAAIAMLRAEADSLRTQQRRPASYAVVNEAHALVIGNSAYPGGNRLANPANDARAMKQKLESLGFKVTVINDANRDEMVRGLSNFSKTAVRADLSVLFYAGHGIAASGVNYMVPVDMSLNDPSQAALQAVSLNQALEQYLPGKTKLVFLDACRDNPLMASSGRGISKGLAPINVSEGTLISYATKDGQTADDGQGQMNSPYTAALLEHLSDPDDIAVVLRTVRAKVLQRTNNRQQPWEYGSLTGGALSLSAIGR